MVTITENTKRITAIRECIAINARFDREHYNPEYKGEVSCSLSGWDIARLSMMYEREIEREPVKMLYRLTGVWMA